MDEALRKLGYRCWKVSPDLTYQFWGSRDGDLDVEVRRYGREVVAYFEDGTIMLTAKQVRQLARRKGAARRETAVSR